jgi:hypothetical protein
MMWQNLPFFYNYIDSGIHVDSVLFLPSSTYILWGCHFIKRASIGPLVTGFLSFLLKRASIGPLVTIFQFFLPKRASIRSLVTVFLIFLLKRASIRPLVTVF